MRILLFLFINILSPVYANELSNTLIGLPENTKTDFASVKRCQDLIEERIKCLRVSMEQMGHQFSTKMFKTKFDEIVRIGPACWTITFQSIDDKKHVLNNDYLSLVNKETKRPSRTLEWSEKRYKTECRSEIYKLDSCTQSLAFPSDPTFKKECHHEVSEQERKSEEEELKKASAPAVQDDYSFSNYKMEFETGMTIGKEYSVEAFYDPNGLYICSFENSSSGGLGVCGNLNGGVVYVHHSFSKIQAQELYKLRGKGVCLTTLLAGGQNWIKRFKSGSCKE